MNWRWWLFIVLMLASIFMGIASTNKWRVPIVIAIVYVASWMVLICSVLGLAV